MKKEGDSYSTKYIFTYSTTHLANKDKVRFYYGLKGRDGKTGVVVKYQIEQLGRTVLLVSENFQKDVDEFLKFWKCEYNRMKVLEWAREISMS